MHQTITPATAAAPLPRRSDAGTVRVSGRDIDGLMLCGEMYGAPYDLLAECLNVQPDRLRGIVARWRAAGYAETGRLGPGPACVPRSGRRPDPGRPRLVVCAVILPVAALVCPGGLPGRQARPPFLIMTLVLTLTSDLTLT